MSKTPLYIQLLNEHATLPTQGSPASAGFDVYANLSGEEGGLFTLYGNKRKLFKTGIATACREDCYIRVAPRSGLAFKNGIDTMAGVIDPDYRGELGVILYNTSTEPFVVHHGMRIAQIIVERFEPSQIMQVESLDDTVRGDGGFGSTGV